MKEALFYSKKDEHLICHLCPHHCVLSNGESGICRVRRNIDGVLYSENYGVISAIHFDPIEKKPLYHFYPGKIILSLGSIGCNMKCNCCQNWQISQTSVEGYKGNTRTINEILELARSKNDNIGVAYTYNEPTVWYEYMIDTARAVSEAGLKNVMVSNGFINEEPLKELINFMDAFNIDLKAFNNDFYKTQTGARLEPVKKILKFLVRNNKHVEITCLIIPTLNDDEKEFTEMIDWIAGELGTVTVIHLSRYHPMFKLNVNQTPGETLERLFEIALKKMKYVYIGNIHIKNSQDTRCPNCKSQVITRNGYYIERTGLTSEGKCRNCDYPIVVMN